MTQVVDGDLDQTPADHARHTKHGDEQQEQLTRAAFDLIAERGFEGLRTRDVAARSLLGTPRTPRVAQGSLLGGLPTDALLTSGHCI